MAQNDVRTAQQIVLAVMAGDAAKVAALVATLGNTSVSFPLARDTGADFGGWTADYDDEARMIEMRGVAA